MYIGSNITPLKILEKQIQTIKLILKTESMHLCIHVRKFFMLLVLKLNWQHSVSQNVMGLSSILEID